MPGEKYLRPEVIHQVSRLDLRAKFIVEGFLAGLHASPFQGFSVEFSEHRKYVPGDDVKNLDWTVYAKTPLLRQEVRGRDERHRLPGDGPVGVDGLHAPPAADQVRILHL